MEKDKNKHKKRVAINGFGRIGRAALKIGLEKKDFEIVAINDLVDTKTLAYLLKRDTVYGTYQRKVSHKENSLEIDGKSIHVYAEKDPSNLPWKKLEIEVVIESSGHFTTSEKSKAHLKAGAKKVIISAPAKDEETPTQVIGVNTENGIKADIVSNASCTTNCVAPVASVMHSKFGIEKATMTTIHSYTSAQNLVDGPNKDLRRARAAGQNIIPTSTGATVATAKTIPDLKDKFAGMAVRVPTITGSLIITTMLLKKKTTKEEVNDAFKKALQNPKFENVLQITNEPLVSSDIIGNPHSAIVDLEFTEVVDGDLVRVLAWYDNEWGYANRLIEMVEDIEI